MAAAGHDVVVVGSGPNGLAAAAVLANAGLDVVVIEASSTLGGGARSAELTGDGLVHDVCSAVHPFGVASPVFRSLRLEDHGLVWRWAEVDAAHPLDGGTAGALYRSLPATAAGLGADARAWRATFGPIAAHYDALRDDIMGPIVHWPRHPVVLARFGLRAVWPAMLLARRFRTPEARALFGGCAAHVIHPLTRPLTAAIGATFVATAHACGWPVAQGGTQAITDALVRLLRTRGATIIPGTTVTSWSDLPPTRAVVFDLAPGATARIAGDRLPARTRRAYRRWRHGPAAFKVDLAVEGGIPWTAEVCRRAGTVHLGGTIEEIAAAERDVHRGRMPERPFVLVGQQYLADPSRSVGDRHPVWAYAHVPHGWTGDATEAILAQIERFAPGARARIVAIAARGPADLAAYNANYVGGDIATGANDVGQLLLRPRGLGDPYRTGAPGVYLCSAATPPGAGVHGMGGAHAARRVLDDLARGRDLAP